MQTKTKWLAIALVLVMVAVAGCASLIQTSYVTLNASKNLYELTREVAKDLYADGKIDDAQAQEINRVAKIYREAHNLAKDALEVYAVTESAEDKEALKEAVRLAGEKWKNVADLINAIQPGSVPRTIEEVTE